MKTRIIILLICLVIIPSFTSAKTLTPREQRILDIKEQIAELKAELKALMMQKDSKEEIKKAKKAVSFDELYEKYLIDDGKMMKIIIASKKPGFEKSEFYTKNIPTIQDRLNLYKKFVDDSLALERLEKSQVDSILFYMETRSGLGVVGSPIPATHLSPSDKITYREKLMDRLKELNK